MLRYEDKSDCPRIVVEWDFSPWKLNWQELESCADPRYTYLKNRVFTLALHLTRDSIALHIEGAQLSSRLCFDTTHAIVQWVLTREALYPALVLEADAHYEDLSDQMASIETSDIAYCNGAARDGSLRT